MTVDGNNPYPSGGVTRPGFDAGTPLALASQGGVVARLEQVVTSVIEHASDVVKDERGVEVVRSKPEFMMIRGDFGAGKSAILNNLYMDCKQGRIKIKTRAKAERRAVVIPIYQPIHALLSQPEDFLDVLQQRLLGETPNNELREVITKAREKAEQTIVEKDPLLKRIYVWRYSADAAIRNGADAIVIILDELEESLGDYTKFVEGYAKIFSILREFTDRQIGPVVTVLGVTPKAIDSVVEETKHALLRRAVTIELPRLTSREELIALLKGYDPQIENYADSNIIDLIYRLTQGNPGFALASLFWAWEEMRYRSINKIDEQLAQEAVDSIVWKGEKLKKAASTFETDAISIAAQRALETEKKKVSTEIDPTSVLQGIMYSMESISKKIRTVEEDYNRVKEEFGQRGTQFKAISPLTANFYLEPNVEFSILLAYGDDAQADERNIADVLEVWSKLHKDFVIFIMPSTANALRRMIDKVCTGKMYRGLEWRELVIILLLGNEDMRELTSLAHMMGTSGAMKEATEKLVSTKYGIAPKIEGLMHLLKERGKTIPYRWDVKGLPNYIQWGIYALVAKRFTDEEFTKQEAINFVLSHYDLVEETKAYYNDLRNSRKYLDPEDFKGKVIRDVIDVLDVLVNSGFAVEKKEIGKYQIPSLLSFEKELYGLIKAIRENEKGRNPGSEDLKFEFFGQAGKANNIYGLAKGMEGKGYIVCIQEGPLQRRFYREFDSDANLTETEITLKTTERGIRESITESLREHGIVLGPSELEAFMKLIAGRISGRMKQATDLLGQASDKKRNEFERLILMNRAKVLALIATDDAKEVVNDWLGIKIEAAHLQTEIQRSREITDNNLQKKRLTKEKASEIKECVAQAEKVFEETMRIIDAFELTEGKKKLRSLKSTVAELEQKIMAELEEIGKAEKNIRIANEMAQEIAGLIERTKPYSKLLGLHERLDELSTKISDARKALEKGDIIDVEAMPLPVFLRHATTDKVTFVESQIAALKRAENLLNAMGQSPDADRIVIAVPRIDKALKRAIDVSSRDYEAYVENLGRAYEEVQNQRQVFSDKLATLFLGAMRRAHSKFRSQGVDKAISQELALREEDVRQLRHLLEEQDLVKCLDVEVAHS